MQYNATSGALGNDTLIASNATLNAVSTVTIAVSGGVTPTPGVSPVVTPVPTPTATPTATPTPAPTATTTGRITTGSPPPSNGGFSFFVFGGGTMPQLVQAAGCEGGRGAFWVTSPLGEFVTYVAGTLVSAVNAAWFAFFPDDIPPNQPMMGSCR